MKTILCHIGTLDGGFGLNWQYPDLTPELFGEFLRELKYAAGFAQPRLIRLVCNNEAGSKPDWKQLRFSGEDCTLFGVVPSQAVWRVKKFLESADVKRRYKISFSVTTST